MQFGIWRTVVVPSDNTEKTAIGVHNYSPSRAQQSKKSFEKFTSCILLVHTNLCITSHFWTTNVNYDNCCQQGYIVTSGNFLYSCTSTFQALKYCSGIFLNLCYTKWCILTFPPQMNSMPAGHRAWQKTNTIFSHLQPVPVVQSSQTLHCDTGRRDHSKKWQSFFDATHSFSYRVHGKIRGKWLMHGFSAITP